MRCHDQSEDCRSILRSRAAMKLLVFLLLSFVLLHSSFSAQPNVVLIMVDDFGYECVTANGGESYQTPNIDKLAASGVRFENCHVQPLCTPTRVQLMTGRYNVRNYINFGTLLRTETTFGNLMQGAGYATGICGKWQLGHEVFSPQHFGFDESCLWQQTRRPPRYANPGLEYNGVEKDFTHGEYGPTLVNDFALSFITQNKEKPFFLYYPMILTHDPFQPTPDSPDWDPTISSENKQQSPKHFADMTAYMDKMVGSVVAKLDELDIRDNTLLLVLGDNGTNSGITSSSMIYVAVDDMHGPKQECMNYFIRDQVEFVELLTLTRAVDLARVQAMFKGHVLLVDTETDFAIPKPGDPNIDYSYFENKRSKLMWTFNGILGRSGYHKIVVFQKGTKSLVSYPMQFPKPSNCFIATAACAKPDAWEVDALRAFRDETLLRSMWGRLFNRCYCLLSPPLARWIENSRSRQRLVRRFFVTPLARAIAKLRR